MLGYHTFSNSFTFLNNWELLWIDGNLFYDFVSELNKLGNHYTIPIILKILEN